MVQAIALVNWPNEALEVTKWFRQTKSFEEISKTMHWIFMKIYSHFLSDKSLEEIEKGNFLIARYDVVQTVDAKSAFKITSMIHYQRLAGECLDKERLMYFAQSKVLLSGDINMEELRKLP